MTESLDGSLLPLVLWFVGVIVVGAIVAVLEGRGGGYVDRDQTTREEWEAEQTQTQNSDT